MSQGLVGKLKLVPLFNELPSHVVSSKDVPFVLGRAKEASLVIPVRDVSRQHLVIDIKNGEWIIEDKSSNGVLLNGSPINTRKETVVHSDDKITLISSTNIEFKLSITKPLVSTSSSEEVGSKEQEPNKEAVLQKAVCPSSQIETKTSSVVPVSVVDEELQCSICNELFLSAVTLSCSHSFCLFCIQTWKRKSNTCPICRLAIKTQFKTTAMDNFIERVVSGLDVELKSRRAAIVAEREAIMKNWLVDDQRKKLVPAGSSADDQIEVINLDTTGESATGSRNPSHRVPRSTRATTRTSTGRLNLVFLDFDMDSHSNRRANESSEFDSSIFTDEETSSNSDDSSEMGDD